MVSFALWLLAGWGRRGGGQRAGGEWGPEYLFAKPLPAGLPRAGCGLHPKVTAPAGSLCAYLSGPGSKYPLPPHPQALGGNSCPLLPAPGHCTIPPSFSHSCPCLCSWSLDRTLSRSLGPSAPSVSCQGPDLTVLCCAHLGLQLW